MRFSILKSLRLSDISPWWKASGKGDSLKLFDLSVDLGEKEDLAAKNPEIAAKMKQILQDAYETPRSSAKPKKPARGKKFESARHDFDNLPKHNLLD